MGMSSQHRAILAGRRFASDPKSQMGTPGQSHLDLQRLGYMATVGADSAANLQQSTERLTSSSVQVHAQLRLFWKMLKVYQDAISSLQGNLARQNEGDIISAVTVQIPRLPPPLRLEFRR